MTIKARWQESQSSTSTSIWGLPWLGSTPSAEISVCGRQTYKHRVWGHFQCASGCSGFWFTFRYRVFRATQRDVTTATVNGEAVGFEFEQCVNNPAALCSLLCRLYTAVCCLCYTVTSSICNTLIHFNSLWLLKELSKYTNLKIAPQYSLFWFCSVLNISSNIVRPLACNDMWMLKYPSLDREDGRISSAYKSTWIVQIISAAPFTIKVGGTQFYCSKADNVGRRLRLWLAVNEFQWNVIAVW